MTIRRSVVFGLLILVFGYFANNYLKSFKKEPPKSIRVSKPKSVYGIPYESSDVVPEIYITGRVISKNKIDLFSEVTGRLLHSRKALKDGVDFKQGQVIFSLNSEDLKNSILAQKATFHSSLLQILPDLKTDFSDESRKWELLLMNFDPKASLPKIPEITNPKEKNFLASVNVFSQYYNIKSQEAQLRKYVVYAPFDGAVVNANLNPGTIIRAGQKIGEFVGTRAFELETTIPESKLDLMSIGNEVTLSLNKRKRVKGKLIRLSRNVDAQTQTVKAYFEIDDDSLLEGQYLEGVITAKPLKSVLKIPSSVMKDIDEVFVVKDGNLQSVQVEVVHNEGDSVIIKGLAEGEMILASSVPGAFSGMKVQLVSKSE